MWAFGKPKASQAHKPARLVVEDLRYFVKRVINGFPKGVKRVLVRFRLGEIWGKLRELQEEYGIEVLYVNPAYTSRACSSCDYVDKENRKSGSEFECKCCGKSLHADVNACGNLLDRVRWEMRLCSVKRAFTTWVKKFLENLSSEWYKCLWSKALSLLTGVLGTSVITPKPKAWSKCLC